MMTPILRSLSLALLAAALAGIVPVPAAAQEPDIRDLRPAVMLLLDTSGSMNYAIGSSSGRSGTFPTCTNTIGAGDTHSRWTTLVSTLTGTFENYRCESVDRRTAYPGAPDAFYAHRSYEPRGTQRQDGLLDLYMDRVKFGVMTLDSVYGLSGVTYDSAWSYLVPNGSFASRLTEVAGSSGGFSYGPTRFVSFPGCPTEYSVNAGGRRAWLPGDTFGGRLISVGADATTAAHRLVNTEIQNAILATRPFNGSAIDALLDDFREYLLTNPDVAPPTSAAGSGDRYAACRPRYAILISEGEIDTLYRSMGCGSPGYRCPYPLPSDTAQSLCQWNGTECAGPVDGLFVVGYDVANATAASLLNDIAMRGGTGSAYRATDTATLLASLSSVLDRAAPGTTTRTTPAYVSSASLFSESTLPQQQYNFTSGFRVGATPASGVGAATPWSGVLERTRYSCTGPSTPPTRQPIDATVDSFHTILNTRDLSTRPRVLYTVLPSTPNNTDDVLLSNAGSAPVGVSTSTGTLAREDGLSLASFARTNVTLTPAFLGIASGNTTTDTNRRNALINWMHGEVGSARATNRMGDIYHSSPVVVPAPRADLADESFNAFRRRPEIATRPTVLYVGTNDGILHAFAVENHTILSTGRTLTAGEEIWGFIPPFVLSRLETGMSAHQFLVDATPVVRDVYFNRVPGGTPSGNDYHTVLLSGLRGGGAAYFALDVSDPLNPTFLWQFRRSNMGETTGRPALAQVYTQVGATVMQRAVAILPGGDGVIDSSLALSTGSTGCAPSVSVPFSAPLGTGARANRRCWSGTTGRSLYIVDVASGEVLREFGPSEIPSPLSGGVSVFTGDVGTIATRAYTVDADGVMWRLDMSRRNPTDWTFLPMHDLYWNDDANDGSPSSEPPIVSTDANGQVVVIAATGDIDDLESVRPYRVASLTERVTYSAAGVPTYASVLNWDIHLADGTQVTGPLELFDSRVYFGTFAAATDPIDGCQFGSSQIWGVSYLNYQPTTAGGLLNPSGRFPRPGLESTPGSAAFDTHFVSAGTNVIALGVSVTRAPTCATVDTIPDPYYSMRSRVSASGGGEFSLTAQLSGPGATIVAGGSSVATFSRGLPTPAPVTYITNWAGNADY